MRVIAGGGQRIRGCWRRCAAQSSMWAANAATVSPSRGYAADGRVHFTPANLVSASFIDRWSRRRRRGCCGRCSRMSRRFAHHMPLPAAAPFGRRGRRESHAAVRNARGGGGGDVRVRGGGSGVRRLPKKFPARQTLDASRATARLHRIDPTRAVFRAAVVGGDRRGGVSQRRGGGWKPERAAVPRGGLRGWAGDDGTGGGGVWRGVVGAAAPDRSVGGSGVAGRCG